MEHRDEPLFIDRRLFEFPGSYNALGLYLLWGALVSFLGAGEQMAQLAEQGSFLPSLITGGISLVLSIWALYAFSAAGWLPKLPMMRLLLIAITLVYLGRGLLGFYFISQPMGRSPEFWIWSSTICLAIGLVHMLGVYQQWEYL